MNVRLRLGPGDADILQRLNEDDIRSTQSTILWLLRQEAARRNWTGSKYQAPKVPSSSEESPTDEPRDER